MSYFDHVRCSACKAVLDPENLANVPGQGMSCPQCKAPLSLKDLFGVRDAFTGVDEDSGTNDVSLDGLFDGGQGRSAYAEDPTRPAGSRPEGTAPAKPERPAPRRPAARPSRSGTGLVRRGQAAEPDAEPGSALDAMRKLKKK